MAGPQDALEFDPGLARSEGPADTRPPPAWHDFNWDSTKAAAYGAALDAPGTAENRRRVYLGYAAADLAKALGKRPTDYQMDLPGEPVAAVSQIYEPDFWRDLAAYRRTNPGFLKDLGKDRAEFDAKLKAEFSAEREGVQARMARQGVVGNLLGGMVGSQVDPINFMSNFIGGPPAKGIYGTAKAIVFNGLVNAGVETLETPLIAAERQAQGSELTAEEARQNILYAGLGGAAFTAGTKGLAVAGKTVHGKVLTPLFDLDDRAMARALRQSVKGNWALDPQQAAAVNVLERAGEVEAVNPFARTYEGIDAHEKILQRTLRQLASEPAPRSAATPAAAASFSAPAASETGGGFDMGRFMGRNRAAESSGNDVAKAVNSSAYGRYQFLKKTWLASYRETFGETGESEAQILAKRADGAVQDKVMATFTAGNVRALRAARVPVDDGTAYLAHFLGTRDAIRVLKAAGDTPIGQLVSADSIRANATVFSNVSSASELVSWARGKMAIERGDSVPASDIAPAAPDPALSIVRPEVRPELLERPTPASLSFEGRQVSLASFHPSEIGVDAELMQFKSGGDQFGVTERLQGVRQWDPMSAGTVTVWEGLDGRRLIADGHQRLGLAKRILAADPSQGIRMNAFVLREADGVSATDARVATALMNIRQGTGSGVDAAKVFRDVGLDADQVFASLPPRSALVRDGKALARLSDEAFGAAVNDVIPEQYAAAIGHLAPEPGTHMALVELLAKIDPPNRRQAEAIIRQAMDAGFHGEHQAELFGTRELTTALFAQKAKALDKVLSELRKLKGAFSVAARNADALDAAGNRIDVAASEAAAKGNAEALGLVEALALRRGNAVSEIFNDAARRLADGEPLARVVKDSVASLRELDLNRALAELGNAGDGSVGSGRDGLAGREDAAAYGDEASLTPAERDALEAEGQGGFLFGDEPALKQFDDPAGEGVQAASDSVWHDLRAEGEARDLLTDQYRSQLPADIAGKVYADTGAAGNFLMARDGQNRIVTWMEGSGELSIDGRARKGSFTIDQFAEAVRKDGAPTADTTKSVAGDIGALFDLDDGKGARSISDIEAELKRGEDGLDAIRGCL